MLALPSTWYSAIPARCSRRAYERGRRIEDDAGARLSSVCRDFRPYSSARVEFVSEPPDDIFARAFGFYGNVKNAPSFLAFVGDASDPHMQEKVGYTGEGAVLEATALGLGTCWVALSYRSGPALSMLKLSEGEKLVAVSPVGYAAGARSFEENAFTTFAGSRRRKPLAGMVTGLEQSARPAWTQAAVEAARLAPSATNRQPWSFHIEKDSIVVSISTGGPAFNVSKRLDCGIAMLHVELGALSCGVTGRWELLEQPQVARFTADK